MSKSQSEAQGPIGRSGHPGPVGVPSTPVAALRESSILVTAKLEAMVSTYALSGLASDEEIGSAYIAILKARRAIQES
jgi:hypothetical protein